VEYNGVHLQIDTGPDFRSQMLREGLNKVDAVLFTHEHQDHIAGLDDTRPIIFRTGKNMQVYGQSRVIDRIKKVYDYAFEEQPYPGAPKIDVHIIDEVQSFKIHGVEITPLPIIHGRLPILGFRIGDMAYLTDTNNIPESTMELLKGLDILVLDALHHRNHFSHYTLEQAVDKANEISAKQTYFIHMSHYMGLHQDIEEQLIEGQNLAYDGLKIQFD
jgi:phosphoribosyl 1,2-cyclic phosphate phosphodiesterase